MASYHHNTMKLNDMKTVKKCFIIQSGKTLNCDKQVMEILHEHVPELKRVDKVEECDFILVFCLVVSRAGTDIERALQKLHNNSDTKPAVVVVLHHTHDSECFVPDSSRSVQREKTITVDVLIHEDLGLLQCTKNTESLATIINYLKPQLQKEKHLPSPQESPSVFRRFWNIFTSSYESTENNDKSKERVGSLEDQELLKTELKLVLRGKSKSSKIMDTIKREINAQTDQFSQQSKMIIGEVEIKELIVKDTLDSGFSPDHVSQSSGASHDYFLLVVPADESTEEYKRMVNRMEEIFGKKCWRNTVIIFIDTKEGQSENQDIMTHVEEREISFLCLNVHENINRSQVSELLKKVQNKVNENQDSKIFKVIESQITTIKKNIKDKESKHVKLKSDILNFETSIKQAINDHESEVNRISDILQSEIEEMNNEVTVEGFKRSLQQRVNKTVREMKQKVKSLAVTLKREKSKIDKNWRVNKGGAGVDDPINLVDLEKNIHYSKSKMQKYMKENKKHVSMLEQKERELEKCRQRITEMEKKNTELGWWNTELEKKNTELGWWNTELEKKNTELEKKNTELGWWNTELEKRNTVLGWRNTEFEEGNTVLRELEKVRKVEGSKTRETGKRPEGEGQSGKEQMMKNGQEYGQKLEKDREMKKTGRSDGGQSKSEEHKDRKEGQGGDGEGQRERRTPVME